MRRTFTAVIERDTDTGFYIGFVPGMPGAHAQGESLDELNRNLTEVVEMLLEDGEPNVGAEFIGTQLVEESYRGQAAHAEAAAGERRAATAWNYRIATARCAQT